MKKKKSFSKLYLYGAIGCIAVIAIVGYIYCFSSFSKSSNTEYVYLLYKFANVVKKFFSGVCNKGRTCVHKRKPPPIKVQ